MIENRKSNYNGITSQFIVLLIWLNTVYITEIKALRFRCGDKKEIKQRCMEKSYGNTRL